MTWATDVERGAMAEPMKDIVPQPTKIDLRA